MHQNLTQKKVKLNIQIPFEVKEKLISASIQEGKKISALVRESIDQKLKQIEKKIFEENMKNAYLDMAKENLETSKDFEPCDNENLD